MKAPGVEALDNVDVEFRKPAEPPCRRGRERETLQPPAATTKPDPAHLCVLPDDTPAAESTAPAEAQARPPGAIVMDVSSPVMDAARAARILRHKRVYALEGAVPRFDPLQWAQQLEPGDRCIRRELSAGHCPLEPYRTIRDAFAPVFDGQFLPGTIPNAAVRQCVELRLKKRGERH